MWQILKSLKYGKSTKKKHFEFKHTFFAFIFFSWKKSSNKVPGNINWIFGHFSRHHGRLEKCHEGTIFSLSLYLSIPPFPHTHIHTYTHPHTYSLALKISSWFRPNSLYTFAVAHRDRHSICTQSNCQTKPLILSYKYFIEQQQQQQQQLQQLVSNSCLKIN